MYRSVADSPSANRQVGGQERRRAPRVEFQGRVEIDLPDPRGARQAGVLNPRGRLEASSVNLSERGVCVRLQEILEIRSCVRLRLFAPPHKRPLECAGRVAWVIQRLDLRDAPPYLYDVGVEFLDPPTRVRRFASRVGIALRPSGEKTTRGILLKPATIKGRLYVPWLERQSSPHPCWHLIVRVEGVPCFSGRYPSQQEAMKAWEQFI